MWRSAKVTAGDLLASDPRRHLLGRVGSCRASTRCFYGLEGSVVQPAIRCNQTCVAQQSPTRREIQTLTGEIRHQAACLGYQQRACGLIPDGIAKVCGGGKALSTSRGGRGRARERTLDDAGCAPRDVLCSTGGDDTGPADLAGALGELRTHNRGVGVGRVRATVL